MQSTSQPVAISDDALKLMVAEHGVRGTARLLGMNERQTDAFRQRVTRGKWLADPHIASVRAKASPTSPYSPVVAKLSPTAALHGELVALGQKTRVSLARTIAKAGTHLETLDGAAVVADAGNVKAIAQTADLVHNWKDQAPQVKIRLDVLNGSAEAAPIDVEASVSGEWTEDCPADPLDEY